MHIVVPSPLSSSRQAYPDDDDEKGLTFPNHSVPGAKVMANFPLFLYRCRFSLVNPRVVSFLTSLRTASPTLPIGVAGFCWGGKFVFSLCSGKEKSTTTTTTSGAATDDGGRPLVDCGFTAHPSGVAVPADAEAVTIPLSLSAGSEDFVLKMEDVRTIETVFAKKGGGEKGFEVVVVEGGKHGFAVRGNPDKEEEARQCQEAEDQAVTWFGRWFGGGRKEKL